MRARPAARGPGWVCSSCRARQTAAKKVHSLVPTRNASTTASSSSSSGTNSTQRRGKLPSSPARTRFAPSPTGNLHLGSIRTALFNYLLARATNGQFLLRIEDTDAKRTIPGAEEQLYRDLRWAGLQWDEGPEVGGPYGPYRQSERLALYKTHIDTLLQTGQAYRCFCSSDRLDELNRRRHEKGLSLGYDRKCLNSVSPSQAEERAHRGEAHVIRFLSPQEWPRYSDLVYGKSQGHGAEKTKRLLVDEPVYEDAILMKSDGFPTYHWANVCDDHDMHITHVVRGSEWMASTPLHVALYNSLDWMPPAYAHVPLLVDSNKQKLSKRNFNSDISQFRNQGIFPETLVNFAALLGWSHTQKRDVMDLPQLESLFNLKITKGNTIVSFDKLHFLQEQHARRRVLAGGEHFEQMIRDVAIAVLEKYGAGRIMQFLDTGSRKRQLRDVLAQLLKVESLHFRTPSQFSEQCSLFFEPVTLGDLDVSDVGLLHPLRVAASTLALITEKSWTRDTLHAHLRSLEEATPPPPDNAVDDATTRAWKRELYHYLRWALLGGRQGPGIAETLEILGKGTCTRRIQDANAKARELETVRTRPTIEAQGWKGDVEGKRRVEKDWKGYSLRR
ncbi:glutamyl-tRNA synthetase [Cladophialophora psammophila CBS 110553]|uniref:Glutamate--tRNA ligase, mitochondrial n=1 Tax=Cladophialophora psammophila CBS 110553 TaxID=1182543 RepID=W9X4B7_9EURO|nr:glutamyl-tRNA synthetase [Cladophialophora psammophila CBS 110553]EXJ72150.1 glutamyl-tRNA synthetase [Cladophialophora psammophila CBS 110553]